MDQFQDNVRVVTNGCNYVTLELTRLHNMLKVRERESWRGRYIYMQ